MDEQAFQSKLAELMNEISTLPQAEREKLEQLAAQTRQRHSKLRKSVADLQESLDYLRLSIKYLMFDLEATRRENGYLRQMLQNPPQADGDFEAPEDFDAGDRDSGYSDPDSENDDDSMIG